MSKDYGNMTSVEIPDKSRTDVINDDIRRVFQWICYTVLCQLVDIFGVGGNIVNIIIFVKQGFKDTFNISLLGLAVSDIGCLSTLIWSNICFTPAFMVADLPFDSIELNYLTGAVPHTIFTRITGWITALITLERCLCITAPLKVKVTLTSKRVSAIVISVFIILISTTAPVYIVNKLDNKYFPERNKTLIGLVYMGDRENIEKASYIINNVSIPFSSFIINTVCAVILVYKLRNNTEWRKKSTTAAQADTFSNRNQKVAKMVVMISTLFIACFIPGNIIFIAMSLDPELFIIGKYKHILITLSGFGIILESINSSVNIFIYYNMSSKYRIVFDHLFSSCRYKFMNVAKI